MTTSDLGECDLVRRETNFKHPSRADMLHNVIMSMAICGRMKEVLDERRNRLSENRLYQDQPKSCDMH